MKSVVLKVLIFIAVCAGILALEQHYQSSIPATIEAVQSLGQKIKTTLNIGPCTRPVTYDLGTFDAGFNISSAQFLAVASTSADVWNQALGKTALKYSDNGTVDVNLIYDRRQQTTNQLSTLGSSIDNTKAGYDALKARYDALTATYARQKATLNSMVSQFDTAKASYEKEVDYWNTQGGAPPAQYDALQKEKASLDAQVSSINQFQTSLNQSVDAINSAGSLLNQMAKNLNLNVQTYNTINTSNGEQFDEGEYVEDSGGKRINIYQFENKAKLQRVLEHEMGHALGLDHVSDSDSIMYYLNQGTNEKLTQADIDELKKVCGVK